MRITHISFHHLNFVLNLCSPKTRTHISSCRVLRTFCYDREYLLLSEWLKCVLLESLFTSLVESIRRECHVARVYDITQILIYM